MNLKKNYKTLIEDLLKERKEKETILNNQENKLIELKAHKKTIISTLAGNKISYHYPRSINYREEFETIFVDEKHPFYILNAGYLVKLDNGKMYPSDYKIIRKYFVHKNSKSNHKQIFYTTIVFIKNKTDVWFMIKDDENNILYGKSIFEQFKQWFNFEIPFKTIEEWLGLNSSQVIDFLTNNNFCENNLNII